MMFVELSSQNEAMHRSRLAAGVNAALRGETATVGSVVIPAGAEIHVLTDARLGIGKALLLCPADPVAAGLRWYVQAVMNGGAVLRFVEPPTEEAGFTYIINGVGRGA